MWNNYCTEYLTVLSTSIVCPHILEIRSLSLGWECFYLKLAPLSPFEAFSLCHEKDREEKQTVNRNVQFRWCQFTESIPDFDFNFDFNLVKFYLKKEESREKISAKTGQGDEGGTWKSIISVFGYHSLIFVNLFKFIYEGREGSEEKSGKNVSNKRYS